MDYKQEYEKLLQQHHQLTEKYNKLFISHKQLSNMLTPRHDKHTQDYIDWYIENYGKQPSSRLIEKFKELNGGVVYEHDKSH